MGIRRLAAAFLVAAGMAVAGGAAPAMAQGGDDPFGFGFQHFRADAQKARPVARQTGTKAKHYKSATQKKKFGKKKKRAATALAAKPKVYKPTPVVDFSKYVCAGPVSQSGIASWYSEKTNGGKDTASMEAFDETAMTAAHKSLPFNTVVRVTMKATGESVMVRINDRGPYVKGRIIDLSTGAAKKLGYYGRGITKVDVQICKPAA